MPRSALAKIIKNSKGIKLSLLVLLFQKKFPTRLQVKAPRKPPRGLTPAAEPPPPAWSEEAAAGAAGGAGIAPGASAAADARAADAPRDTGTDTAFCTLL